MPSPAACDACRLRKVKCVRPDEDSTSACAFCTSIGIPCHTSVRQRQRTKGGRKSQAAAAAATTSGGTSAPLTGDTSISTNGTATTSDGTALGHPSGSTTTTTSAGPTASRSRLLGVPGLTQQALDTSIDTFFATVGLVTRLSEPPQVFRRRARVRLYHSRGLDVPAELADVANNPASTLLVLAVTRCGAPFTPYRDLAIPIHEHCARLLDDPATVTENELDAVEAVLLLSEQVIRPRYLTPTTLDPLGKGNVIDLAFHYNVHIRVPRDHPDHLRRLLMFGIVLVHDAIRSCSGHTTYRINEEDIGWPLPVHIDDFPWLSIAFVARDLCSKLLSPRAKLGLRDQDVQDTLSGLHGLRDRMKLSLATLRAWASGDAALQQSIPTPMDGVRPLSSIEQLFLLSTHNWLYLVMWVAIAEDIERYPGHLPTSTVRDAEAATMAACEDEVKIAQLCMKYSLHVRAPRGVRNHMGAFILFLVRVFVGITNPTVEQVSQYFALGETLYQAVKAATNHPESDALADALRMALYFVIPADLRDAARVAERGLSGISQHTPAAAAASSTTPSTIVPSSDVTPPHQPPQPLPPPPSQPETHQDKHQQQPQQQLFTQPFALMQVQQHDPVPHLGAEPYTSTNPLAGLAAAAAALPPPPALAMPMAEPAELAIATGTSLDWGDLADTLGEYGFDLSFL